MSPVPDRPKIYHITHISNLARIVEHGSLWSDARRVEKDCQCTIVGMSKIKQRRLQEIEVACHPGSRVGQYVPFYFCPRSIMLYILHRGNHPDLDYHEGQEPMIHFQADLRSVVEWAEENSRSWAFTDRNAGSYCVSFCNDLANIGSDRVERHYLNGLARSSGQRSQAGGIPGAGFVPVELGAGSGCDRQSNPGPGQSYS